MPVVVGKRSGGLAGRNYAHVATIQSESNAQLRPKDACPLDEPQCLGECGTSKQPRLSWGDDHLRGQQRRGREHADVRWSVDGRAIKVASDLRRVVIERVTREIDESAASRKPLLRAGALTLASADTSKMQHQSRVVGAALLIEERDDHGLPPRSDIAPLRRFPRRIVLATEEDLESVLESLGAGDLLSVQGFDADPGA